MPRVDGRAMRALFAKGIWAGRGEGMILAADVTPVDLSWLRPGLASAAWAEAESEGHWPVGGLGLIMAEADGGAWPCICRTGRG